VISFFKRKSRKLIKGFIQFLYRRSDHKLILDIHRDISEVLILEDLIKKGINISTVYDIGANVGQWTKSLMHYFPRLDFVLFEANKTQKEHLEKLPFKFFTEVLSDKEKNVMFYAHGEGGSGDSYFLEDTVFYNDIQPKKIKAITLDSLVRKENLPTPDFVKIDTQGSELDILKGGIRTLKGCKLIHLEVPIYEYNLSAPTIEDYIKYLKSIGYIANNVIEIHSHSNVLTQIDIFFIRENILKKLEPDLYSKFTFLTDKTR